MDEGTCEVVGTEQLLISERLEGYKKGKEEGEKSGYERALKESHAFLTILQRLTSKIMEQKSLLGEQIKREMIEFCLLLCEKVIRQELDSPEKLSKKLEALLTESLSALQGENVKIFLSSHDLAMVENHLKHYREIGLQFLVDKRMTQGDCRIETKTCLLNCAISREIEEIRSLLKM